jgi:hypothetical protein
MLISCLENICLMMSYALCKKHMLHLITPCLVDKIEDVIMLHMFTSNCKSRSCFALCQAHDLKRAMSGEVPNFTNHAGHETQMMKEGNRAQSFEHHQHLQVSRTDVASLVNFVRLNIQGLHQVLGSTHPRPIQ